MTSIRVRYVPPGSDEPVAGWISFTPRSFDPNGPITDGPDVLMGGTGQIDVDAGVNLVEVRPTSSGWYYAVQGRAGRHSFSTNVLVPPSGEHDFESLVRVDPKAGGLEYEPDPEWRADLDSIRNLGSITSLATPEDPGLMSSEDKVKLDGIETRYAEEYGVVGDGETDDTDAVLNAISGSEGKHLVFSGDMLIKGGPIRVTHPISISGGNWYAPDGRILQVRSSDVTVSNMVIQGPGHDYERSGLAPAILFAGETDDYITDVRAFGNKIYDHHDHGIRMQYVRDFLVEDNLVQDFAYAGIGIYSGEHGLITRNTVRDAHQVEHVAYGIITTDSMNDPAYRSRHVVMSYNTVENVPEWEGLDTHGGSNISFVGNTVKGCLYGIMLTPGASSREYSAINCRVQGNYVDSTVEDSRGVHIGAFDGHRNSTIVTGNTFVNLDRPISTPNSSGFDRDNTIIRDNWSSTPMEHDDTFKWFSEGGIDRVESGGVTTFFDTGWRDISNFATEDVTSANFRVRRTLDSLHISGSFVFADEGSGLTSILESLPRGWRPDEQSLIVGRRGSNLEQHYMNWNASGIQWRARMGVGGSVAGDITDEYFTSVACAFFVTLPGPDALPDELIGTSV